VDGPHPHPEHILLATLGNQSRSIHIQKNKKTLATYTDFAKSLMCHEILRGATLQFMHPLSMSTSPIQEMQRHGMLGYSAGGI